VKGFRAVAVFLRDSRRHNGAGATNNKKMKNTKILSGETCNRAMKRFLAVNSVKCILAAAAGALLTSGTTLSVATT
jgi:hypothetical protein